MGLGNLDGQNGNPQDSQDETGPMHGIGPGNDINAD